MNVQTHNILFNQSSLAKGELTFPIEKELFYLYYYSLGVKPIAINNRKNCSKNN